MSIKIQKKAKNILVVAAHPDDEVLGCGGTVAKHTSSGDEVNLIVMTDGISSRSGTTKREGVNRREALVRASKILGIKQIYDFRFPDNKMDTVPLLRIVKAIETICEKLQPTIVYTHHSGDLNVDHRRTQEAVMTACRPQPGFSVKEIYGFEVLSSTEWASPSSVPFLANVFVDISRQLPTKLRALKAYSGEMRPLPHSRSRLNLELLARHRGFSVGLGAAEAFVPFRIIRK